MYLGLGKAFIGNQCPGCTKQGEMNREQPPVRPEQQKEGLREGAALETAERCSHMWIVGVRACVHACVCSYL